MATSQRRVRKVMTDERPHRGPSGSAARVTAPENPILVMQRTAGNRAVGRLLPLRQRGSHMIANPAAQSVSLMNVLAGC